MKKRGFGKGKWNGVGGKLAKDESFEEAARRETFEEINIEIRNIYKVAELSFFFQDEKQRTYPETRSEVFIVDKWSGKAEESEEMRPKWFKVEKLPFSKMWEADRIWLPQIIEKKKLMCSFHYNSNSSLFNCELTFISKFNYKQ